MEVKLDTLLLPVTPPNSQRFAVYTRDFIVLGYKPPQISYPEVILDLVKAYGVDFRLLYIVISHILLDYISRPAGTFGQGYRTTPVSTKSATTATFVPSHTEPSSLPTSDQTPPREIIPTLSPSLRMKLLFLRLWELHDSAVYLAFLSDLMESSTLPYMFWIALQLSSRQLGSGDPRVRFCACGRQGDGQVSIDQEKT